MSKKINDLTLATVDATMQFATDIAGATSNKVTAAGIKTFTLDDPSLTGEVTLETFAPAQITADQNNYDAGSIGLVTLSSDASRTITGFSGGVNGKLKYILNTGANNIVLAHQSTSSSAANRIISPTGSNITLAQHKAATLLYEGVTHNRWIVVSYT